jgi:hypothetical protein
MPDAIKKGMACIVYIYERNRLHKRMYPPASDTAITDSERNGKKPGGILAFLVEMFQVWLFSNMRRRSKSTT